jgi:hypothetical protein
MPLVPVVIRYKGRASPKLNFVADTGADHCTINAGIGRSIGIDIKTGTLDHVSGVEQKPMDVWFHNVEMDVEGRRFKVWCGFADIGPIPGLLGRDGFFNRFTVIFDQRNEHLVLKYKDADLL